MFHAFHAVCVAIPLVFSSVLPAMAEDESCTISEDTQLQFGTLEIPSSGSQTYTVHADGSASSGTGTLLFGTDSRGQYTLTKTAGDEGGFTSITIDIQNVSTGNANVSLGSFTGVYNGSPINEFPASGLDRPGAGGTTLYLGATATYNSSISAGDLTPSFDIVVTYE